MKILMAEYQPWQHRIEDGEHKYARFFLEDGHQVFWLANFVNINRFIRKREDDLAYIELWRQGIEEPIQGLTTFTPLAWLPYARGPVFESEWLGLHFMRYTLPSVQKVLTLHGFDDVDVLWIGNQRLYSVAPLVKYRRMVYRMKDDVEAYGSEPRSIGRIEQRICQQADIVFFTANRLRTKAQRYAQKTQYLPNGVDFEFFREPNLEIPTDLEQIPPPRLIYVGQISHWFDFESVLAAAKLFPDYSFVLIGPVNLDKYGQVSLQQLLELPNVHILGSRPFVQIRAYLRHSQVGLIPFLKNSLTHTISPIKLFEYCAAGLPVVSTRLEETERLSSPALLYDTADDFVRYIRTALVQHEALERTGIEFGQANTWRRRYAEVRRQLDRLFNEC